MAYFVGQKCVMIIAGEASGDLHGAKLVQAMRQREPSLFFCGIGSLALKRAGVRVLVDASELSVVGITEAIAKIPILLKGIGIAKKLLKSLRPDLLILIDFPDFNLHLAATAKKLGIPVLYYISPQIWAWRRGRVNKIRKLVDHVAVILPFEEAFYKTCGIPVTFVGHPLLDLDLSGAGTVTGNGEPDRLVIGLLPGSRDKEITRHLPLMMDASRILSERFNDIQFIVSHAPSVKRNHIEAIIQDYPGNADFNVIDDPVGNIFRQCKLVVAASGTVTLEAAISGTPLVIVYKVSPISYWLGKILIRVKHIGLANLIAGREVVPELLQKAASSKNIADTVSRMLSDEAGLTRLKNDLYGIKAALGSPGASDRVADIALSML